MFETSINVSVGIASGYARIDGHIVGLLGDGGQSALNTITYQRTMVIVGTKLRKGKSLTCSNCRTSRLQARWGQIVWSFGRVYGAGFVAYENEGTVEGGKLNIM